MKGKRKLRKVVAVMLAAVMMLGALAVTPVTVKAEVGTPEYLNPTAGKQYFADVGTGYLQYEPIKWLNERGAFGKIRGKEYHFHPGKLSRKGKCILWIYNMYGDAVGWGSRNYNTKAKKSWQWAQSNGIIKKGKETDYVSTKWLYAVLDKLAGVAFGGSFGSNLGGTRPIVNSSVATYIHAFGTISDGVFDPRNLE